MYKKATIQGTTLEHTQYQPLKMQTYLLQDRDRKRRTKLCSSLAQRIAMRKRLFDDEELQAPLYHEAEVWRFDVSVSAALSLVKNVRWDFAFLTCLKVSQANLYLWTAQLAPM